MQFFPGIHGDKFYNLPWISESSSAVNFGVKSLIQNGAVFEYNVNEYVYKISYMT